MRTQAAKSLPVIMYHYVNDCAGGTSVSPGCFEDHCRTLAEAGWRGVSLEEAEAFLTRGETLPRGSALFTFDDGFLDNYLEAMPLLQKYGHQGVVFAVSARLEKGGHIRAIGADPEKAAAGAPPAVPVPDTPVPDMPASDRSAPDTAGANGADDWRALYRRPLIRNARGHSLRRDVFCSHGEVRAMEKSGVLAVASHSRAHLGVCTGPEFADFIRPGDQPRTFYLTGGRHIWGMPAFPVRAGLAHRAFVPAPELEEAVLRLVPQDYAEAAAFFADEGKRQQLRRLVKGFEGKLGVFESDAERQARMWQEIAGGKKELEGITGRERSSLCWPWGEYCEEAFRLAREAGFKVFFTVREGPNPPGAPYAVRRFKGKARSGAWLLSRLRIYARPLLGALY
ncbi:polysaccharide deacetylase family protein, partial [Desulfovibrio sp. OttesenSCG-928-A18]|nr:polysaccharide deacetylase family protein [Desulfovibrio sp. OttesenSCG-928-A18]